MKQTITKNNPYAVKATRAIIAGALVASTLAGVLAVGGTSRANAAPAPVAFKANATADAGSFKFLELKNLNGGSGIGALTGGQTSLVDMKLGVTAASVDSTAATAANASAKTVEGGMGGFDFGKMTPSSTSSAAPNSAPVVNSLASLNVPVVGGFGAMETSAESTWNGDCSAVDQPISKARSNGGHIELGNLELPIVGDVLGIGSLLKVDDVLMTQSETRLVSAQGGADDRAVQAIATGNGMTVNLTNFLGFSIGNNWELKATASGQPGGASVEYKAPTVAVKFAGAELALPNDGTPIVLSSEGLQGLGGGIFGQALQTVSSAIPIPGFDASQLGGLTSAMGLVQFEFSLDNLKQNVAEDGTHADGNVSMIRLKVGIGSDANPLVPNVTIIDTALFPLTASADMAAGGLQCATAQSATDKLPDTGENIAFYGLIASLMVAGGAAVIGGATLRSRRSFFGRK